MAKQVSTTYSNALFGLALEQNKIDALFSEVLAVREGIEQNKEFLKLLCHPSIDQSQKIDVVENIFKDKADNDLTGLFIMMIKKDRQHEILAVLDAFIEKVKKYKGIGVAFITSAIHLNDEQKSNIEAKLLETTSYREIEGNYAVNESLIGGMVIRIDDRVVDSSIKTQIENMAKTLRG